MALTNDVIAASLFALVGPAVLFVAALGLRQVLAPVSPPARLADRIVQWYAAHPQFALWVLLLLCPLSAFVLGSAGLMRTWSENPVLGWYLRRAMAEIPEHWPALSVGGATLLSLAVLVMITAHIFSASQSRRGA